MGTKVSRTEHPHNVAEVLNVSVATLSRYAREGLIPFDVTPKGHRRYNTAEVVETLQHAKETAVSVEPLIISEDLVFGPEIIMSDQSRMEQDLRATRTVPDSGTATHSAEEGAPESAFDEMLSTAKRVLVTVG